MSNRADRSRSPWAWDGKGRLAFTRLSIEHFARYEMREWVELAYNRASAAFDCILLIELR